MRRSVKVAALTSAAALLAIGASMTSFAAARGWTQEDGEWVWLDSYGERATATFKMSGNNYYYLNDDGYLASDELVEYDEHWYYVDENGAMVRNAWKEVENTDDEEDFEDTIWYYFQSSGKAYENVKTTINGKTYIFDEDGRMLFGWINDKEASGDQYEMADKDEDTNEWTGAVYYAGEADDGVVVTNDWRKITVNDDSPALKDNDADTGDYDYWFYFGSNGKKIYCSEKDIDEGDDLDKSYKTKTIKGVKYGFAWDGHMVYDWAHEASDASQGAVYFGDIEDGALRKKGWFKAVPSTGVDDEYSEKNGDNEAKWFYGNSDGTLVHSQVKSINGKKYLFNKNGECQSGLYYLVFEVDEYIDGDEEKYKLTDYVDWDNAGTMGVKTLKLNKDSSTEDILDEYTYEMMGDEIIAADEKIKDGIYYFAAPLDTDAALKTGTATITIDGDDYSFKFRTSGFKGKGVNGLDGSNYYINGRKVKADSDDKFVMYKADLNTAETKIAVLYGEALTASDIIGTSAPTDYDGYAVVSSSGTLIKSGTKKDGNDYKLKVEKYLLKEIRTGDTKSTEDPDWKAE